MTSAEREGGLWRPANGTEGMDFDFHWCSHCLNRNGDGDWEDEFGNQVDGKCITQDMMFWAEDVPLIELIIRHGRPWCKDFRQDPSRPSRCLFTKELF